MKLNSIITGLFCTLVSAQTALADNNTAPTLYTTEQARENICSQFGRPVNCDPSRFERSIRSSLCDSFGNVFVSTEDELKRDAMEAHFLVLGCREFYAEPSA